MPRVRRHPKPARPAARPQLLEAGLGLFAERGFEGASTHAIAGKAGVPQGLIRYHFGGKEGLWREVVRAQLAELAAALAAATVQRRTLASAVPELAGAHASFIRCVCHALLEPGPRRDQLLVELNAQLHPYAAALRASLRGQSHARADDALIAWMWLGAALALPLFAPAIAQAHGAAVDPELALRAQREQLAAWSAHDRALTRNGPWSLAAAARRRSTRGTG